MISYSLMALPVTEVGPRRPQVIPQLSPFQWLLSLFLIALPLLTDSTMLLNVSIGHLLTAELFNFPKFFLILNLRKNFTGIKTKQKPGRLICNNNHNLIKYNNSLSLYALIHLGL